MKTALRRSYSCEILFSVQKIIEKLIFCLLSINIVPEYYALKYYTE